MKKHIRHKKKFFLKIFAAGAGILIYSGLITGLLYTFSTIPLRRPYIFQKSCSEEHERCLFVMIYQYIFKSETQLCLTRYISDNVFPDYGYCVRTPSEEYNDDIYLTVWKDPTGFFVQGFVGNAGIFIPYDSNLVR